MASSSQSARSRPELTIRAVLTGMALGAVLTPCNVYSGLKIGWAFNMSVAAGLLAFAFWRTGERIGARRWGLLENNINQTAASSAASIISSGLAAPIPALALLTGQTLAWQWLALWLFAISLVGVVVAAGLRNQMLEARHLPFPSGVATAETIQDIHAGGGEAASRLRVLFPSALVAAALKLVHDLAYSLPRLAPGLKFPGGATAANLGFALDPSLLMVGFGVIAGVRAGLSALAGAAIAWGVLGPLALMRGWAQLGGADGSWFGPLVEWLLWPGATLMTVAALASFAISLARMVARGRRGQSNGKAARILVLGRRTFAAAFLISLLAASSAQVALFGIGPIEAIVAVLLSFGLAAVAGWVSGETGITPVGALGKVTQLSFALISPGNVTANLMSANVTGGAAGQCADLLHDLRTGQIIGATPHLQFVAQLFGVLTGSLAGAAAYLAIIPDPQAMLLTPDWPAPAVATWKAVAEVLSTGLSAMPPGALPAMGIAAIAGLALALADAFLPARVARFLPSATAAGLGFVIPAWNSISLAIGALGGLAISRLAPDWARTKLIVLAAGLIVGESLAGVFTALATLAR
ncbi:MAG: OPT family oligopeptide transporter [Pseudomonadota bacterium]|nr:OPT family oligopeptide transporter [Pseudomonadota bacterium]